MASRPGQYARAAHGQKVMTSFPHSLRVLGERSSPGSRTKSGEMRRQELPGSVQCSGRFVENWIKGLEDVRHPGGDIEGDLSVGGGGLPREADGVIEENLMSSGLDDQGRHAGQVGEYGADEAKSGVLSRTCSRGPGIGGVPG